MCRRCLLDICLWLSNAIRLITFDQVHRSVLLSVIVVVCGIGVIVSVTLVFASVTLVLSLMLDLATAAGMTGRNAWPLAGAPLSSMDDAGDDDDVDDDEVVVVVMVASAVGITSGTTALRRLFGTMSPCLAMACTASCRMRRRASTS